MKRIPVTSKEHLIVLKAVMTRSDCPLDEDCAKCIWHVSEPLEDGSTCIQDLLMFRLLFRREEYEHV